MDSLHSIISKHQKGKHLSFEECVIIQTRIKDGFSLRAIAREIGCCLLLLAMKLSAALFYSITVIKSFIKLNMITMLIRLTVGIVVAN